MDKIGFVILHYQDVETTDRCVRSILALTWQERIRIIIVDNDVRATERQRDRLGQHYRKVPRLTVLTNRGTGGFSEANNLGYSYARDALGCAWIILLNNDIQLLQKDFLLRMERAWKASFEGRRCHILAPDVIRQSTGEHQAPMDTRIRTEAEAEYTIRMNRRALAYFPVLYPYLALKLERLERERLRQKEKEHAFYGQKQKDIVPFGAFLICTPFFVVEQEAVFVPETPFFYEEYILTLRCQRLGYRIAYDPDMKVLHESGEATRKTYRTKRRQLRFMMERTARACEIYLGYLRERPKGEEH